MHSRSQCHTMWGDVHMVYNTMKCYSICVLEMIHSSFLNKAMFNIFVIQKKKLPMPLCDHLIFPTKEKSMLIHLSTNRNIDHFNFFAISAKYLP